MNQTATILLRVGLLSLLSLGACSKSPEKDLLGKWQGMNITETAEFFPDGTILTSTDDKDTAAGKYSLLDATRLKIELGGKMAHDGPLVCSFSIKGEELELSDPSGKTSHYERAFSPKRKNALIGKWSFTTNEGTIEFFPDGKLKISADKETISSSYSFLQDGHLKLESPGNASAKSGELWQVFFDQDRKRMTIIDQHRQKEILKRAD